MTLISVPDMSCGHCKASVEAALARLPDTAPVAVDLTTRRVEVKGAAQPAAILAALDAIGFPAAVVAQP